MDRFKNNIENVLFSNKTHFIKNRRQGYNSNTSNISSNSNSSSNPFEGEYTTYLLWILLFIIVIIICYLTVMTAKYLSTDCPNKKSWFKYIIRFCYNDICYPPAHPVINNVHYLPLNTPNQNNKSFVDTLKNDFNKFGSTIKNESPESRKLEIKKGGSSIPLFGKKEVFHIANQDYTFEQAKCKCESYNAKLATYDQLVDAYNNGAEWCTYGWSSGQKAYYPTQKCNWEKKSPEERLKCGNPGLNGGFFADPYLKFGVNCYGKKPKGKVSKLKDPVCNGGNYCELPQNFGASNRLETDEISPFNSDRWNN
jgi:hypothetical protein